MSFLAKLKAANDRKELAALLGFKPSALTAIIYQTPLALRYTTFDIPKKSGGTRTIKAPEAKLKKLQSHLAHFLDGCLTELEADRDARPVSYAFRTDGSIAANAKNHKCRRYVLNLDLADFFPAFNFGRVRGFFLKDQAFQLEEQVATTIAQIACDGVALPQGSPCSPVISELIGRVLDVRLLRLSKKYGVRYSRYADDLTFSTNQKEFPVALAVRDPANSALWALGQELLDKITGSGFQVNGAKTRMHYRGSRQVVTGLVVNKKVNIKSEYYRNARAMCDAVFQTGQYFHTHLPKSEGEDTAKPDYTQNLKPLEGILSHIYAITQTEEQRTVQEQREGPRAIRSLYRRFLFYKYCIALKSPLLITEGKTDSVYLREAIRHRSKFHPQLGKPGKDGFEFAVRFFNYGGQAHEIMDLGGGTGDLKSIPLDYLRNIDSSHSDRKPFKHKPMNHPVILVLDNDDGLAPVAATIKKNFGILLNLTTGADFYHVVHNLYVIKTPEIPPLGHSCMEDLFPKTLLNTKLNGKSFNPAAKINPEHDYSKEIFAKAVVKASAVPADFIGFDPLLERIAKVLDHHQ